MGKVRADNARERQKGDGEEYVMNVRSRDDLSPHSSAERRLAVLEADAKAMCSGQAVSSSTDGV